MKQLNFYIAAALIMSLSASALAASTPELRLQKAEEPAQAIYEKNGIKRMAMPLRESGEADELDVTVKIKLGTEYFPAMGYPLRAYGKNTARQWAFDTDANGNFEGVITLPAGKYDFMLMAEHFDYDHTDYLDHSALVILEDVEINGSESVVELDAATATNHIAFRSYNHDGEETKENIEKYVDGNNTEIVEEGNARSIGLINSIVHSEYNMLDYACWTSYRAIEPTEENSKYSVGVARYDIWVNNVSDKYEFRQVRQIVKPDYNIDMVILTHSGCDGDVVVKNNPDDYFNAEIELSKTPLNEDYSPTYSLLFGSTLLGGEIPGMTTGIQTQNPNALKMWVSPGQSSAEKPLAIAYWSARTYETDTRIYNAATPYLYLCNDNRSLFAIFAEGAYGNGENGWAYGRYYPGNPGLAIDLKNLGMPFCESTPFCLMSFAESYDSFNQRNAYTFAAESYGQMGELRGEDKNKSEFTIHYNGEEVLQGMDLTYEWPYSWSETEHDPGEYLFTTVNKNVRIDGIDGRNVAEMFFDDRNSDFYPPAMQMLQTRNKNGDMNIRFNNSSDGELRIVGGDFNPLFSYPYEGDDWFFVWYDMLSANLKVEYAPNGTEDFREITGRTEYDGEGYWGFNEMHIVPLDEVSTESSNKWYDLRITFTDEAGNYQRQLLSPAFRIDNPSVGICSAADSYGVRFVDGMIVCDGIDNAKIEIYDAAGRLTKSVDGDTAHMDMTAKGIYVVKVSGINGTRTLKIVI